MRSYMGLKPAFFKYAWGINAPHEAEQETRIREMSLACCRRDSAALQVIVAGDKDFLLTTSGDTLFWKGGALPILRIEVDVAPRIDVEVKLIGLVADNDRLLKSDPLLDQGAIHVTKRQLQQVWVECHAGAETLPGMYRGTVRLYAHTLFDDETLVDQCSFTVAVKDVLLPEPKDYEFHLDLFQHPSAIARHYQVPRWSDDHFRLLDAYLASLACLGQKTASVFVSEIPYVGQHSYLLREPSDVFEYSMVGVRRTAEGRFSYDFSALDRYVETSGRHGIVENIDVFGLLGVWQAPEAGYGPIIEGYPDAIRVRYFDEGSRSYKFLHDLGELQDYIRALEGHFIELGWIDRVRVIGDEPADVEVFERQVEALRECAPSFRHRVAINHVEFIQRNVQGITDYVPILSCAADEYERLRELQDSVSGRILYYVCCWPDQPNTFIGSPAVECRVLPWLAEKLGLDGLLRWAFTAWVERPFEDLAYRNWRFGDMLFVYPGASGRPVASLRYKWLQRGIRDYELMQILKAQGRQEQVGAALARVFRFADPAELSPGQRKHNSELYSLEPADYDRFLLDV